MTDVSAIIVSPGINESGAVKQAGRTPSDVTLTIKAFGPVQDFNWNLKFAETWKKENYKQRHDVKDFGGVLDKSSGLAQVRVRHLPGTGNCTSNQASF
ncbi:unnamed protein product [Haemonchus placei]|uniref:Invasin n=1 Tax=Haemonchus placei TaxID=6290 RepID=A0A0N4X788_HAEPC|nr:unnamed protein product [Haemonchus placei]